MIKIENIDVFNFEGAIRGMRNPLESWAKSDSYYDGNTFIVGEKDIALMKKLYHAGSEHRKCLRQIFVSMDITAPLFFLKELDQYKVGVTSDSCSTMHCIHKKPFSFDDFSCEHLNNKSLILLGDIIDQLNYERQIFLDTKDKDAWWQMIQLLPTSYNQKRTYTMSYENIMAIISQRSGHKLDEWNDAVAIFRELPYIKAIRGER